MSNEIINSVKRLERVGAENSRVTKKLKAACETLGRKLEHELLQYGKNSNYETTYTVIGKTNLVIVGFRNSSDLIFNYDGNAEDMNYTEYLLCPSDTHVSREVALHFAEAVAKGLIDEVNDYITKKNIEDEIAIEKLTIL